MTLAFGEIVPRVFEPRRAARSASATSTSPTAARASRRSTSRGPGPGPRRRSPGSIKPFYFIALALVAGVAVHQLPPARLAPRPRLDRRARGRGGGGRDGREPRAREAAGPTRSARPSAASPASFLGVFQNTINVDQFEFGFSVFILCMIILGGMGNIWGVILGAVALSMIDRFLLPEAQRRARHVRPRLRRHRRSRSASSASCCW